MVAFGFPPPLPCTLPHLSLIAGPLWASSVRHCILRGRDLQCQCGLQIAPSLTAPFPREATIGSLSASGPIAHAPPGGLCERWVPVWGVSNPWGADGPPYPCRRRGDPWRQQRDRSPSTRECHRRTCSRMTAFARSGRSYHVAASANRDRKRSSATAEWNFANGWIPIVRRHACRCPGCADTARWSTSVERLKPTLTRS